MPRLIQSESIDLYQCGLGDCDVSLNQVNLKSVEEIAMFMDVVVFAGIGTVALMIAFFVGLYYFVRKEEQKRN